MECKEVRVDTRTPHTPEELAEMQKSAQLLWSFNQALPGSEESQAALKELLGENLGEGSRVAASVVTKDVPDYAVAVGNPAKVIRILDAERCEAQKG